MRTPCNELKNLFFKSNHSPLEFRNVLRVRLRGALRRLRLCLHVRLSAVRRGAPHLRHRAPHLRHHSSHLRHHSSHLRHHADAHLRIMVLRWIAILLSASHVLLLLHPRHRLHRVLLRRRHLCTVAPHHPLPTLRHHPRLKLIEAPHRHVCSNRSRCARSCRRRYRRSVEQVHDVIF